MDTNRLVLGYLLLVGVPLLVMLTTSELGKGLTAEPALAGEWSFRWDGLDASCTGFAAATITQSGQDLSISWKGAHSPVWLATVMQRAVESQGACGDGRTARLQAQVTGDKAHRELYGHLLVSSCSECRPVTFAAVRAESRNEARR